MTSEEPLVAWVFLLRYSVNYSSWFQISSVPSQKKLPYEKWTTLVVYPHTIEQDLMDQINKHFANLAGSTVYLKVRATRLKLLAVVEHCSSYNIMHVNTENYTVNTKRRLIKRWQNYPAAEAIIRNASPRRLCSPRSKRPSFCNCAMVSAIPCKAAKSLSLKDKFWSIHE